MEKKYRIFFRFHFEHCVKIPLIVFACSFHISRFFISDIENNADEELKNEKKKSQKIIFRLICKTHCNRYFTYLFIEYGLI